ncbi:MAG: IS3 family transposase, partial [Clostridiales bacterium]|nr:IS3 family transposase [Clostridiales bacterium]
NEKWVTDITELPTIDGKLYISGIFDCYDNAIVGLTMDDNMRKELVMQTVNQAVSNYRPDGVILHSDRGSQYTSEAFKDVLLRSHILQSMNSAGGRCHDNAKCESMWGRAKEECFYKYNTSRMRASEVKSLVFRYFMSYWNNRRICSANGGLPPSVKRARFYSIQMVA